MAGAPIFRDLPDIQVLLRAQKSKPTETWRREMEELDIAATADFISTHRNTIDMRFHSQLIVGLSEALRFQVRSLLKETEIVSNTIVDVTAPGTWDPNKLKEKPNKQTTKPRPSFEDPQTLPDPADFLHVDMVDGFDISDLVEHNRMNLDRITLTEEDDGLNSSHYVSQDAAENMMLDQDIIQTIMNDWATQTQSQDPNQLEALATLARVHTADLEMPQSQRESPTQEQILELERARLRTQELYGSIEAQPSTSASSGTRTSRVPGRPHEFSAPEVSAVLKKLMSSGFQRRPDQRPEDVINRVDDVRTPTAAADGTLGDFAMDHDGAGFTDNNMATDGMIPDQAINVTDETAMATEGGPQDGQLAAVSTTDARFGGISSIRGISDATFADMMEDDDFISLLPPVAESTRTAPGSPRRRRRRRHRRFMDVQLEIPNSVFIPQSRNTQVHTETMVYGSLIIRASSTDPITSPQIRTARSEVPFEPPSYELVPPTELFKMGSRRFASFINDELMTLVPMEYMSSRPRPISEEIEAQALINRVPETQTEIHQQVEAEIHQAPPEFQEQHPGTAQNLEVPGGAVPNVTGGVSGLTGSSVGYRQKDASNSTDLHPQSGPQIAFQTPSFPISLGGSSTDFQAGVSGPVVPPSLISLNEQRIESTLQELEGHTDTAIFRIRDQIRKRKVVGILLSALDDHDSQMMFSDVVKEYGNEQERPELSYIMLLLHSLNYVTLNQAVDYEEVVIKIHHSLREYNVEE